MQEAKHRGIVFHAGAGISTLSGIPDFRGPNGLWTKARSDITEFDLNKVKPSYTHWALSALEKEHFIDGIITQNYDGLFKHAGFPQAKMAEVHGNIFIEYCPTCEREYHRNFTVPREDDAPPLPEDNRLKGKPFDHRTGRKCDCGDFLHDHIVHFTEDLNHIEKAEKLAREAYLSIVVGTKLQVTPSSEWPFLAKKRVIVNLQKTGKERKAHAVVFARSDRFFEALMRELGIEVQVPPS
eukprot:gb/GECG01000972.1/.p1 GENE.gb/GECG01000972.1/~~gb/GECG01000972.1/.p1  ORF type:complete len:239 (+),score=26.87 gb/GECG01000972.1/:1-717(+)